MSVQYLLKGAFFLMAGLLAACGSGGDDDDGGGDNQKPPMVNSFQAAPNATGINTPVTFRWDVSDVNGDTLTCTLDVDGDSTVDHTISDCANTTSQAHTYTAAGSHSAKLTVSDGNGGTADRTVTVTVTVANTQPVFDSDFSVTPNPVSAGSPVTFGWDVSDTDGDTLTCTLDIDGDNAVDHTISDCANTTSQAHTYATAGDYTAKLTVDDGNGGMVEQTVSLTVDPVAPGNRAPMFDNNLSVAPNPVEKGDSATFSWDVSDADGDTLTCTLDVDGDSTVDYTIDDCANATTQTHTYAAAGDYTAKLSVDDGNGGMVEQTINLVVSNTAPVFDNNLGVTPNPVEKGDSATFSWDVSDADGDTLTCTLDVDADSSADYTIDDCAKTTSQAHTYAAAGDYIATLTVNDGNGSTVEQSVTITVNNATNTPPVIESFSVNPAPAYTTVATTFYWQVSDADGDTLTCKLDVDADGTDDYTIDDCVNMASRDYVYAASGNYAARLTVSDGINDVQTTLSTPLMVKSHLLLDVSAQGVVSADGRAPFTITVSNVSAQPLDDVSVVFTVPPELRFYFTTDAEPNAAGCPGGWCLDGMEAAWTFTALAAGESRTVTIN
ncbi:MAG TPA: hypothetical protein ENI94_02000, partial [Gammaproteobacteria bacterium]|nr:hypothetical protein [Gammaproteobacteria bacterium]